MTPAIAPTALDALEAELTRGGIVTRVLEAWAGAPVRAERVAVHADASAATRLRLRAAADEPIGFRRVRLMVGGAVLSEADNWFVPGRLTPAMRAALDHSDTPFGRVIAPLAPRRETLACERLAADPVLRVRALVLGGDGTPLAEVVELYRSAVFDRR